MSLSVAPLSRSCEKMRAEGNGMSLKADERPCRNCGELIPAQPSGPGRPREFCSSRCRRSWYHERERERELADRLEARERAWYELDTRIHGKRAADRLAKERAGRRGRR